MTTRLAAVLLAVCSLAGCGLRGGTSQQLAQAQSALRAGRYSEAAIALHNLSQKQPANAEVQLALARAQYLRGDAAAAEDALKAARAANADVADVDELRAKLALARGQFAELLRDLDTGRYALPAASLQLYRGRAQQGMGNVVEALATFETLLAKQPSSAELHLYAAECHAALGRPRVALQQLEQAQALQPDSAAAARLHAALLADDAASSEAALQKAIELAPGQLTIPEQLALLAQQFQIAANRLDAGQAEGIHKKLLVAAPQAPLTQWAGAQVSLLKDNPAEADAALQRLVQQAPDFGPGRPALIGALLADGNLELAIRESATLVGNAPDADRPRAAQQAIKQAAEVGKGSEEQTLRVAAAALILEQMPAARWILEQGVKVNPQSESIALFAIQQQLAAGQPAQALQRARALATQFPRSSGAQALLAAVEDAGGDHAGAQQIYEMLWKKSPSRAVALALADVRLHTRQGDPLQPLRQWLGGHPNDLAVHTGLASAALALGQDDTATAEFERIVAIQPANAVALNNLAWLYSRKNDARALSTARRAYEAGGMSAEIADTYGWLLAQSGDIKAGLPLLEKAAHSAPGKPEIRYHYAAVLARSSAPADHVMARQWLSDALRTPGDAEWRSDAQKLLAQLPQS